MTTKLHILFTILLLTLTLSHSRLTRPESPSSSTGSYSDQLEKHSKGNNYDNKNDKGYGPGVYFGPGTEPASDFDPPGGGSGYSGAYGGLSGGYSKRGVVRRTVVCKEKGHCYMKKLTCPAKCFKSFSRSGKGYGRGCTIDCKKKCLAYC